MELKANTSRISKYFDLPSLNQTEQQQTLKGYDLLHTPSYPLANPAYIFGIEVEVENVPRPHLVPAAQMYWNTTVDNSLRNNGVEFVSLPLKAIQIEGALTHLQQSLPPSAEFSPRTSVHIHMNVRDLSIEQITSLLVLYTTVENLLFRWVGHNRDQSVFCIKLTETNYVQTFLDLHRDPRETVENWNKYTAFNLHPMQSKGTVEFRHLEGNIDIPRILTWINFLACLKTAAKRRPLMQILREVAELNTTSMYEVFVRDLFGEHVYPLLLGVVDLKNLLEESVSYVKLATIQREIKKAPQNEIDIIFDDVAPQRTAPARNREVTFTTRPAPNPRNITTIAEGIRPNPWTVAPQLDLPTMQQIQQTARERAEHRAEVLRALHNTTGIR